MIRVEVKERVVAELEKHKERIVLNRQLNREGQISINNSLRNPLLSEITTTVYNSIESRKKFIDKSSIYCDVCDIASNYFNKEILSRMQLCNFKPKQYDVCINMNLYGLGAVDDFNKLGFIQSVKKNGLYVRLFKEEKVLFVSKSEYWSVGDLFIKENILYLLNNRVINNSLPSD